MTEPLVTIVVPCYRGRKYLRAAIDSCLRQTFGQLEVIVVDDNSPDADHELAEEMATTDSRIRVVRRSENGGIGRALNTGFGLATGRYFTRLAQDDLFREDAIELLVRQLRAHPEAGLAYADMQLIDESGKYLQPMPTAVDPGRALLPANRVGLCVMWPRTVWETVGPFDPAYDLCDDYEFFLRVSRRFPLTRVAGEAPFFFRYHAEQGSVTKERAHDLVRSRVLLAHNWALLRARWYRPVLWKRLFGGWARLLACRVGVYGFWKHDGDSLFGGRA